MNTFKLKYLGGIGRVTGSCTLVEKDGVEFLVDCGMVQGEAHAAFENAREFQFKPHNIKFVILTHAHLDHCGLIPRLVKEGFKGKVYCTSATKDLAIEILKDSAKIGGHYTHKHISRINFQCFDRRRNFKWGHLQPVDNNLMMAFYRSAHILGSVSVVLADTITSDSIWFSGDIGQNSRVDMPQPLLKFKQTPDQRNQLVVCESTYGSADTPRESMGFEERRNFYSDTFCKVLGEREGCVLIPAFSMQRTQDILSDLCFLFNEHSDLCGGVTVVCDSPLGKRISGIYARELFEYDIRNNERNYKYLSPEFLRHHDEESIHALTRLFQGHKVKIGRHTIGWQKPGEETKGPCVVISSAGMCSQGPVVGHLLRLLPDSRNTVLLTGYQGKGTVGGKLTAIMQGNAIDDVPLFAGESLRPGEVRANIKMLSCYSGHADKREMLEYLFNTERQFCPGVIHLNHGDNNARAGLAGAIQARFSELDAEQPGVYKEPQVVLPTQGSSYGLHKGEALEVAAEERAEEIAEKVEGSQLKQKFYETELQLALKPLIDRISVLESIVAGISKPSDADEGGATERNSVDCSSLARPESMSGSVVPLQRREQAPAEFF